MDGIRGQVKISSVVSEVQTLYQSNSNLIFSFETDESYNSEIVNIDQARLKRAICNLLNNAVDATQLNGYINVRITTDNNCMKILVEDNGIGFSENSEKVFARGFTTKLNGNGIGLSSTKEFIEAFGGTINIENLRPGTRITLTIPSLKSPAYVSEVKKTVVLIDDDVLVRFNWKRQGERKNVQVHSFESLEDFLDVRSLFSEETPIFIDSNLGHQKGELLSEKLYELGFKTVYLTTGLPKKSILNTKWITDVVCKSFESAVLPKLQDNELA